MSAAPKSIRAGSEVASRPYFSGTTLLFNLSQRQRELLRHPPAFYPGELPGHDVRSLTIMAKNGLILIDGGQVSVTESGRVAGHLYDLLGRLEARRGTR